MADIILKRKDTEPHMTLNYYKGEGYTLPYLTFPALEALEGIRHFTTTRMGGISSGYAESLSFRFEEDTRDNVVENFRRAAAVFGAGIEDVAVTDQTHTSNIRIITREDAGKKLIRDIDYHDIDGIVTDVPHLVLCVVTADCVPVFLADPVKRVIAIVHAGWMGTESAIAAKMADLMEAHYGCRKGDMVAAIGPSICRDCYEVGEDVAHRFRGGIFSEKVLTRKNEEKSLLDLWQANKEILINAGVSREHISVADVCTCCNPHALFSHRYTKGKRGNIGSFMMLE